MALFELTLSPGIDKQTTPVGAINRWIDSDNIRFRYGLPEKVGGWASLLTNTICGVARQQHAFVDLEGNRYVAIGTDKFLLLYFEFLKNMLYSIFGIVYFILHILILTYFYTHFILLDK